MTETDNEFKIEGKSIYNTKHTELKRYIKTNNLPILTIDKNRKRLGKIELVNLILEYNTSKDNIIEAYNNCKKWHTAYNFPEEWKQMWGCYRITDNKWKDTGNFTFKSP